MPRRISALAAALVLSLPAMLWAGAALAQDDLPWLRKGDPGYSRGPGEDAYRPDPPRYDDKRSDATRPYEPYTDPRADRIRKPEGYYEPYSSTKKYGAPYEPYADADAYDRRYDPRAYDERPGTGYSSGEIMSAGHSFFGSISKAMASVIEYAFQKQGRPNGYILGQDAGGAFVAGLRYGEGTLHTKDAGTHKVFWQGPSIGYDAGAEGSKVMVLVYNLSSPEEIYQRFGGVDGSAYLVGGVGVTFQKSGDVVVAPIRAGVGLRLGASVGYLKYTRKPTWNPF